MKYWVVRSPFKTRTWEDTLMAGVFSLYGIRGNRGGCSLVIHFVRGG